MAERRADLGTPGLRSGSRVVLAVSNGSNPDSRAVYVAVPQLAGLHQGAALERLQAAGLQARVVSDYSDIYARGKVIGQLPSAGSSAAVDEAVAVLVSAGGAGTPGREIALPDVVGMRENDAVVALESRGFSPQVVRVSSATVPAGVVLAQLPNEAWTESMPKRTTPWWIWAALALLVLALAAMAFLMFGRSTTVPRVIGLTQAGAETSVEDAGLRVGSVEQTQTSEVAAGVVVAQSPPAGQRVARGSVVGLVVATQAPLVGVPDVRGLTQSEAVARIEAVGLRATTETREDATARAGTVVEQQPLAGTGVAAGSTIRLTIASAAAPTEIEVPQVTGFTRPDAESTLAGVGLRVLVVENPSATVAEGVVIAELPASGETVAGGTTVALVVSSGAPEDATTVGAPDVVGETLPDAQAAVADAGLRSQPLVLEGTNERSNTVIAQWPEAGVDLPPDSTMVLLYAR